MNKYKAAARAAHRYRQRELACLSKRAYPTREAALCPGQDVYQCCYCDKWHRSTMVNNIRAQIRNPKHVRPARRHGKII